MKKKQIIVILLWLGVLATAPLAVWSNPITKIVPVNKTLYYLDILMRVSGLLAFILAAFQIVLGSFMEGWKKLLGKRVLEFSAGHGLLLYSLILFHPLLRLLSIYISSGLIDPFYIFTDVCLLCKTKPELYFSFGRISFWLASIMAIGIIAKTLPWWKKNWKYVKLISYPMFILITLHAWFLGKDVHQPPFIWTFWAAIGIVGVITMYRIITSLKFTLRASGHNSGEKQ